MRLMRLLRLLRLSALLPLWLTLCCVTVPALAAPLAGQTGDEPVPMVAPKASGGLLARAWQDTSHWLLAQQRRLHRQLSSRLRQVRAAPSAATLSALIGVSFLYGVLHAAGPGHGKAVISAYLLTHRRRLRQGVLLAALAALLQGLTAILLVFALVKLGGWLARDAMTQARAVENVSFALVALLGLWLAVRGARLLWARLAEPHHPTAAEPAAGCCAASDARILASAVPQTASDPPTGSLGSMLAVALAVGLRPCTGAVLVLAVANLLNLWTAGMVAVLAMSLGTAITVALLASFAVQASQLLGRIGGGHRYWRLVGPASAMLGGLAILALGLLLLQGSATTPAHPLLLR